jgi:hypothetical protein
MVETEQERARYYELLREVRALLKRVDEILASDKARDSTLPADVPIKPPCRCVSVPTPGWVFG